jgi:hypothetical protein
MAEIASDLGVLAKQIGSYQITGPDGVRELSEMCRVLCIHVAEVLGDAEFEVFEVCRHIDRGKVGRAKRVARPLRHAHALMLYAAKRSVMVSRAFRKEFAEELSAQKPRQGRREFSWGKG